MKNLAKPIMLLFLVLFTVWFHGCNDQRPTEIDIPVFSEDYSQFVKTLSSDEFEGRAPTTPGGKKTKDFIENHFRSIGLKPANDGSFRQEVPLVEINGSNFSDLVFTNGEGTASFTYLDEMMVNSRTLEENLSLEESEVVFAGYGIVAPEFDWNDYEGMDVKGKTVVVLVNDPGYELQDDDFFTGRAMTYYGRWTYKYEEAARQGAAGIIIVHEDGPAGYGWDVVYNSWSGPQYDVYTENGAPTVPVEGWITSNSAETLFAKAGYTLDELRERALQQTFTPFSLGITASVSFDLSWTISTSANIAGYIEGSRYPEETIIYMAHWDHLGKTVDNDQVRIYNGAIDNATGTAAIMAIAERFTQMEPAPARSVLFLAVTAEESGLIGSRYYGLNPLFPLEKTAGGINIDGLNPYGPTHDVVVIGYNASDIQDILEKHADNQNRRLVPDQYPERGYFFRSDHFSLVREGVPMIYANSGHDYIGRDDNFAQQAREDMAQRYHSTKDVVHDGWDWSGLHQDLWLFYHAGADLANSNHWPQWREGSEFRAIREASAHKREQAAAR